MRNGVDVRGDALRAIVPVGCDVNDLSKNQDLQNVVRLFSLERLPIVAILISELHVNIFFLISSNRLTKDQLHESSTMNNQEKTLWYFILIMCVFYVLFREFNQCRSSAFGYFASPWN